MLSDKYGRFKNMWKIFALDNNNVYNFIIDL